jgi:Uma2 family endonuclease
MMLKEVIKAEEDEEKLEMPSFNHSFICGEIAEQINKTEVFKAMPELTLKINKGITPDVSVYLRKNIKPNFSRDYSKFPEMPILAIEVISASQNIQHLLEKAKRLVKEGVKAVWTIEPFTNTIFVTTEDSEKKFYNQEVESEGIKVDFRQIFNTN